MHRPIGCAFPVSAVAMKDFMTHFDGVEGFL